MFILSLHRAAKLRLQAVRQERRQRALQANVERWSRAAASVSQRPGGVNGGGTAAGIAVGGVDKVRLRWSVVWRGAVVVQWWWCVVCGELGERRAWVS